MLGTLENSLVNNKEKTSYNFRFEFIVDESKIKLPIKIRTIVDIYFTRYFQSQQFTTNIHKMAFSGKKYKKTGHANIVEIIEALSE